MIKEYTGTSKKPIRFAIICDFPVCSCFSNGIRTSWLKKSLFISGLTFCVAETFAGTGIVELHRALEETYHLQQIQSANTDAFQRFNRLVKRQSNRALPGKVVNFIRLNF